MASKTGGAKKPKCKYWDKCYQKAKAHKAGYLHPGDEEEEDVAKEASQESVDASAELMGGLGDNSGAITTSKRSKVDLQGKKILFLGTFKKMKEAAAKQRAGAFGCVVSDDVTEDVDFVISGENSGKKGSKAKTLGLRIVTEDYWEGLLSRAKLSKGSTKKAAAAAPLSDTDEEMPPASPQPAKKKTLPKKPSMRRQRTHVLSDDSDGEGTSDKYKPRRTRSGTLLGPGLSPQTSGAKDTAMDTTDAKATTSKRDLSDSEETSSPPKRQKPKPKAAAATGSSSKRKIAKCRYWDKCYRKEADHLETYLHPGDDPSELYGTLADGEEADVAAGTRTYRIKRTGDNYYCNCIGWKTQNRGVDVRTCRHLKEYLGEDAECKRVGTTPKVEKENKGGEATIFRAPRHKQVSLLLAHKYTDEVDPKGWWISEKLDGVRAYWDGKTFFSRLGNEFIPPAWFIENYPTDMTLDGELFGGRSRFQETVAIVKNAGSARWAELEYHIFDAPSIGSKPFESRIKAITEYFEENSSKTAVVVSQKKCTGRAMIDADLEKVEALGGEGLMIRQPASKYEQRRSHTLLKIKTFYDAEARVIGHEPGKGRNAGRTGALRCEMECGTKFSCGSGLSDKDRMRPPKIGSIITYKFQEYTNSGVPRFPTYLGVRIDADGPKDAVLPAGKGKTGDA